MNLAAFFGLDKVGEQSVKETHATITEALDRVSPILDNLFNRTTILVHTVLNRFTISIHIDLKPWNPEPSDSTQIPKSL